MANPQDLLNQYLNTAYSSDLKKQNVTHTAESKKQAISDKQAYAVGAAAVTGLGGNAMPTQEENDLLNLTPYEVLQKYGQERGTALLTAKYQGTDAYLADENASRDGVQAAGDLLSQAISGFGQTVGGIGALGVGLVSDAGGAAISGALDDFNRGMGEMRSDASRRSQEAFDARSALREQASTARYNEEIADGSPDWAASLARIGSDAAGAAGDVLTNPTQFLDLTAQGVGSMAAIPLVAGQLAAAVPAGVATRLIAGAIGPTRTAVKAGRAIEKALPATAAIGLTESGGTFVQATNEVMNMKFEDLAKVSPEFNKLVAGGMTQEAARAQLANDAGTQAALTQLPAALAAGALVSKFEAAPGARRSVTEMLANLGKETLEEGTQSASSQLAVNQAIQSNVDAKRELAAGTGTQFGVGAVAGMGTAGAIQAPGVVAKTTGDAVSAVGAAINAGVERVRTQNEQASPVADAKVVEAAQTAQAEAPVVQTAVAEDETLSPDQKVELDALITEINDSVINMDGEAISEQADLPPVIQNAAKGQTTQAGFIQALAKASNDTSLSDADRIQAYTAMKATVDGLSGYLTEISPQLEALPEDHPVRSFVSSINNMAAALQESPTKVKADKGIASVVEKAVQDTPLSETDVQNAPVHLAAAELAPEKTTPESVNTLLKMASSGSIKLTDAQRSNLQMLSGMFQNAKEFDDTMQNAGETPQSRVSTEIKTGITTEGGNDSALQHAIGVRDSVRKGDLEDAKSRLEDLGLFAQHMQNKVGAINEHMQQDKPTAKTAPGYMKLVGTRGDRKFVDSGRSRQGVTPSNPASVKHAQLVTAEANFVTKTYNTLAATFPELGLQPMQPVELDTRLEGKPSDVAASFASGSSKAGKVQPKAEAAPKQTKEPVEETKAAPKPEAGLPVDDAFKAAVAKAVPGLTDASLNSRISKLMNDLMNEDSPRKVFALDAMTIERDKRAEAAQALAVEEAPVVEPEPAPVAPAPEPVAEVTPEPVIEPEAIQEVTESVEPVENDTIPVDTLADRYPNLAGGVNNKFHSSFKIPMNTISNLDTSRTPINDVVRGLEATIEDESVVRAFKVVLSAFPSALKHMNQSMNTFLAKPVKGGGKSRRQAVLDGETDSATYFSEGRGVAIAEVNGDKVELNTELMAKAYLAGVNWLLNGMSFIQPYDTEYASKVLRIPEEEITEQQMQMLSTGVTRIQAIDALSSMIQRYWGVTPDRTVVDGYTKGIPQAIAGNIIEAMLNQTFPGTGDPVPVLVRQDLEVGNEETGPKTVTIFTPASLTDTPLNNYRSAIDKLVSAEPELVYYMGDNIPPVATTQMHNPVVPNTAGQQEMIRNQNATSYRLNPQTLGAYHAMGIDFILDLFGEGKLDKETSNKNDFVSRTGRNTNIVNAWMTAEQALAEMERESYDTGIPVAEVDVHFAHNVTSVGRAQQLGRYTPQSSKLMRTLLLPTNSAPLDLTDPTGVDYQNYMLAMAQTMGIKVHNFLPAVSQEMLTEMLTDLDPVVKILQDHLLNGGRAFTDGEKATMKELLGKPSFEKFQALTEYARFLNTEDKSAYTTQLYLEADGMSNGPFNAMALFTLGKFTEDQIKNLAKSGLYIGGDAATNNSWNKRTDDRVDVYQAVSTETKEASKEFVGFIDSLISRGDRKQQSGAKKYKEMMNHLNRMMDILLEDVTITLDDNGETEIEVTRGISKNPTTITTYGSGKQGIANKLTNAMLDSLYSMISSALQAHADNPAISAAEAMFPLADDPEAKLQQLDAAMRELTGGKAFIYDNKKIEIGVDSRNKISEQINVDKDYTISPASFTTLAENVRALFVDSLDTGIKRVLDPSVEESTTALREATQAQSIIVAAAYAKRVNELLPKPGSKNYIQGGYLSQQQQQEIFSSLSPLNPIISTGSQNFFIAGKEKTGLAGEMSYGASFDNSVYATPTVYAPADPGVKGIATLTIGPGDGMTIQRVSQNKKNTERAMFVFDGINYPIDYIRQGSIEANKAAYQAILGNPIRDVAENFTKFLTEIDGKLENYVDLTTELKVALGRAYVGLNFDKEDAATFDAEVIMNLLRGSESQLQNMATDIDARHNALNQVNLGMDQMAAAGSPYLVTDKIQLDGEKDEIAQKLSKIYEAELAKLRGRDTLSAAITDTSRREKRQDISSNLLTAGVEHESGVRIMDSLSLSNLVRNLASEIPRYQVVAITKAMANIKDEGYKVVHGSYEQLLQYNETLGANGINAFELDSVNDKGLTLPARREIWLINPTSETLAHEMIHASTYKTVLSHMYSKYDNQPDQRNDSVDAIEELMTQFLDQSEQILGKNPSPSLKANYANAVAAINGALTDTTMTMAERRAMAVNEYMAWTMTNSDLAKAQSSVPVKLSTLVWETVKKIRDWIFPGSNRNTDDMLSNLVWHTKVLMAQTQPSLNTITDDTTLMQSSVYGSNERLTMVDKAFSKQVVKYLTKNNDPIGYAKRKIEIDKSAINADHMRSLFEANGFPMTMQEGSTFFKVIAALGTQAEIDPSVMNRMQELYAAATQQITVESFLADEQNYTPAEYQTALSQFNVVLGRKGFGKDKLGRSTLLPAFMALALVNDQFREVLAKIPVPRTMPSDQERAFDRLLENQANKMLDGLSDVLTRDIHSANITQSIDKLAGQLEYIAQERESVYDNWVAPVGSYVDRANKFVVDGMDRLSKSLMTQAEQRKLQGNTGPLTNAMELGAAIINEEAAGLVGEGILAGANSANLPKWLHDLVADLVGRVASNAELYDMIKKVRTGIQRVRNQFRTELPKTLAKQFTRQLTKAEWSTLHTGIAKTDVTALVQNGGYSVQTVMELVTDQTKLNKEIVKLEARLNSLDPTHAQGFIEKAEQLATFMMTGAPGQNLQRNALAIASRAGYGTINADKTVTKTIDNLVSLYAVDMMPDADKASMATLYQTQKTGVEFAFGYTQGLHKQELDRLQGNAVLNHYKGHMPSLNQDGVSIVIANDRDFAKLSERSYIRVTDYNRSRLDTTQTPMGYYYAPINGKAMFNQGILQNVRQTVSGVDAITGYSVGAINGGRITDQRDVKRIRAMLQLGVVTEVGTNLMPIFNAKGVAIAYERSADPAQLVALNPNTNLGDVLGAWKGRLAEEELAVQSNKVSIEAMATMYANDIRKSPSNKSQYVDLFDKTVLDKNPVLADAVKLFTPATMEMIQQEFPNGEFLVRRDMLDNVIGYRSATVGDAWTGNTYWSKNTQETVRKLATITFGNKAYQYLVDAEEKIQGVVHDAKTIIIVKSVVVPVANFMSNVLQLVARGVPLRSIASGLPKKLAETRQYVASEKRAIEAEAELHATNDASKKRRLAVEIRSIRDSYKRMSIWPLIERGELSSMTDDAQPEDIELTSGRLAAFMENQVNKLPPALRAAGKYALITKDTAIYKGLRKSVEYGDFLAKAVLWDDLVKRQGVSVEEANGRITEEFVNFDRLGGRNRQYLESMGLLWFYNFKIRSSKVALSTIRNNPLHALLAGVAPAPGSIGSPISDNLFSLAAQGDLGYSMGVDQLFGAPLMHPLDNLLF